ncbi:MAG: sensor histidine kinase [Algoriphagus aquaeductus]|uniref:sensor histidine kinase n=1 Tax=Algoriphagus aquaeductus TaxID=475299 RepID=UPI00391C9506
MDFWNRYRAFIWENIPLESPMNSLDYWRDYLFRVMMLYLIPLSIVALIPSFFVSYLGGHLTLILFDFFAIACIGVIGFTKFLSISAKKVLLILITNALALVLMLELGSFGPGLMYLVASGVFISLLFSSKRSWLGVFSGVLVCILVGLELNYSFLYPENGEKIEWVGWLAISINVLFINGVIALVVPILFEKMQQSILARQKIEELLLGKQDDLNTLIQELEIKNSNLSQLIKGVSEDLQEPLRNILSFLGQLKRRFGQDMDPKVQLYIDFAMDGGRKMREIILGLLDLAQIGRNPEEYESFELSEVVEKVMFLQKKKIQISNARIEVDSPLPKIKTSKTYLIQALNELVSNALKFQNPEVSPKIWISCEDIGCSWKFSVSDNGLGFDCKASLDPFVVFSRLHPERETEGFGIGLALVKKISENLRGSVWAESVPGEGSVFFLKIPKAA